MKKVKIAEKKKVTTYKQEKEAIRTIYPKQDTEQLKLKSRKQVKRRIRQEKLVKKQVKQGKKRSTKTKVKPQKQRKRKAVKQVPQAR